MRRRSLVSVLVASGLLLTACGGDDSSGGGDDDRARTIAEPSSAAPAEPEGDGDKTLTEAELSAALLTVADLPTGYTAVPPTEDDDSETTGGDDECSAKFKELSDAEGTEAASAEASFEGGGLGTILEESLESYEDEDQLKQRFDDVVSVLSECPTFSSTEDGETTDFTLGALSFPKLGDDTVALAITGKTPDFEVKLNIVVVRLGRNVMSVSQGGLTADAAALEQAARAGLDKLAAATG